MFTVLVAGFPTNGITPSNLLEPPLSGVTTTAMGTSLVKFRASTRTVWFGGEPAGKLIVTNAFVSTGIETPAASTMFNLGV